MAMDGEKIMSAAEFTIADVLAWARTKPADERYDYMNSCDCALAQFSRHIGLPIFNPRRSEMERYQNLGKHLIAEPQTFGALANRLGELCPVSDTWTTPDAYLTDIEDVARERVSA
jgi:hypothetical protein